MSWIKSHKIIAVIIVLLLIPIAYIMYTIGILSFVSYIDRHAYDTDYSKLPQPLSTRGLPVPETDVPVVLPPDPGESGKATLAGIDSNNDGVRDDLEREIVYMYPKNEEVRRVLRAMVKTGQEVITTEGDHDHFMRLKINYLSLMNCSFSLVFGPNLTDLNSINTDILNNMLQNTKARKKLFEENSAKATPFAGVASPGYACDYFKGQY